MICGVPDNVAESGAEKATCKLALIRLWIEIVVDPRRRYAFEATPINFSRAVNPDQVRLPIAPDSVRYRWSDPIGCVPNRRLLDVFAFQHIIDTLFIIIGDQKSKNSAAAPRVHGMMPGIDRRECERERTPPILTFSHVASAMTQQNWCHNIHVWSGGCSYTNYDSIPAPRVPTYVSIRGECQRAYAQSVPVGISQANQQNGVPVLNIIRHFSTPDATILWRACVAQK